MPPNFKMLERYSQQCLLPEIGKKGQQTLATKVITIVGVGALGTVAAELLTRAGVGKITLIDRDVVEESNLQRQSLFTEQDLGKSKAYAAQEKLKSINSSITIEAKALHLNAENCTLLKNADLVLDGSDNLATRFLINDYCRKEGKPWIYAAAIKTKGYVFPVLPKKACLRCFLPETNTETCDTIGVLNTITYSLAALQATIAMKILLQEDVNSKLYQYNIWEGCFNSFTVSKHPSCPSCQGQYSYLTPKEEATIIQFCSSGRYRIKGRIIDVLQIQKRWKKLGKVGGAKEEGVISLKGIILFEDGTALIKAKSKEEALSLYSKYIGN